MSLAAALAASLLLADLPDDALARLEGLPETAPAAEVLARVREAGGAYRFDAGAVVVDTDKRWWASARGGRAGEPLLELRRWPGDTVLAVYGVARSELPPVPRGSWRPAAAPPGERRFEGTLETTEGARPARWVEREISGSPARLAALLVEGDAGLGAEGAAASRAALLDIWERLEVRAEPWGSLPAATAVSVPAAGLPPREGDERSEPWQTVAAPGFTLGLPPGIRARRYDSGVPPPRPVDGGDLWLRGRFRDRAGEGVAVGDASRSGYVAIVDDADAAWLAGSRPPRGAARTRLVDSLPLDDIVVADTGARSGRVERRREEGWAGSWLVFRLAFGAGAGAEIGLPVEGAWRSLALFWIPATFRPEGRPPAPPPIDAAERLGIRFERLRSAERQRSPLTEGWLSTPGLRVEIPRGWYPVVSIRAADGYPITIFGSSGSPVGTLRRLPPDEARALVAASEDWRPLDRPSIQRAAAAYARADGARLFVAREGHAFLFEPSSGAEGAGPPQGWDRLADSAALSRSPKADP